MAVGEELDRLAVPLLGWGRIGFGVFEMLAPGLILRTFIGVPAEPAAVALFKGFGARDAVVGAGLVWADRSGDASARARWFAASAVCDIADFVAYAGGRRLPATARVLVSAMAGGAAALGIASALRARA